MLKILKASAGSGKTFTLAGEYIRLLFAGEPDCDPHAYRHILAVTFTNKATDEMKSRILKELHIMATSPEKSSYIAEILEMRKDLSPADVAKMARYLDSAWPGDDPQCGTCPILPVCMGGCPHRFMQSGVRRCPWFKDDLDGYVLRRAREAQAKLAAIPLEP